jgi:hypothetical protein
VPIKKQNNEITNPILVIIFNGNDECNNKIEKAILINLKVEYPDSPNSLLL